MSDLKAKKVLIADDEDALATALELKLKKHGYDVKRVSNGEEVIASIKNEDFDLILLDLIMPRMDGFKTLESLKSLGIKIPVIVTSNLGQQEDIKRVKDLGAQDYMVKSDTPIVEIVNKVSEILK